MKMCPLVSHLTRLLLGNHPKRLHCSFCVQGKMTSLGKGSHTITLYNHLSNYDAVISDVPYKTRSKQRPWVCYKGARPFHRSNRSLTQFGHDPDFLTLYKYYYCGNPELKATVRPPSCPSMFLSQWDIGENKNTYFETTNDFALQRKPLPKLENHTTVNRYKSMSGLNMLSVLDIDQKNKYSTSYKDGHSKPLQRFQTYYRRKQPPKFNILSGKVFTKQKPTEYRLNSGNRILSQQRPRSEPFQLG